MLRFILLCTVGMCLLMPSLVCAQGEEANYDEAKVGNYTLPDPLVMASGEKVATADAWRQHRRPELLKLFETHVYGKSPGRPLEMSFEVTSVGPKALGGKATR